VRIGRDDEIGTSDPCAGNRIWSLEWYFVIFTQLLVVDSLNREEISVPYSRNRMEWRRPGMVILRQASGSGVFLVAIRIERFKGGT
jgi:hypothetical protein